MSQVILFDLDGTLTESGEGITKCVQYALEKMGIVENELKKLECFIGPPLKESFMKYGEFTDEQAVQAVAYYRERYETEGMFENRLYPKIVDLLELLQINDKIMGVASSKPEQYVKQILEHFGIASYFNVIVGSEMNGEKVTKTEVIEEALSRLQMKTERDKVVMVGDRAEDVQGALACGIQCVGVLYGYGSEEELKQAGAVYLAEEVEDLAVLASPSDEETTEHVESIRQNDLKEPEAENTEEIEESENTESVEDSEKTKAEEETPSCEGESTEVQQETPASEEPVDVPSEETQEVSVSEVREEADVEQTDVEEQAETNAEEKEPVQQASIVYKRLVFDDDDDDDFLEPAIPRVKKSKVVKMHPIHHIWRWIYPMVLYLMVSVAVTLCTGIYFSIRLLLGDEVYSVQMLEDMIMNSGLWQTMISAILMAFISWLLYRADQKKRELGLLGNGKATRWCPFMVWFAVFVLSIAGCQLLNDVIELSGLHEQFPTYSNVAEQAIFSQSAWLILVTVGLVAPLAEELIFRGLLFGRMKDWMKPWLAAILSAVLFGVYHGNVVQCIYAFVMGIIFAIIYHRTGTLRTAIFAHIVANLWSILGYGLVKDFAKTIEYGTWIVIGVSAVLCLVPVLWIAISKRK